MSGFVDVTDFGTDTSCGRVFTSQFSVAGFVDVTGAGVDTSSTCTRVLTSQLSVAGFVGVAGFGAANSRSMALDRLRLRTMPKRMRKVSLRSGERRKKGLVTTKDRSTSQNPIQTVATSEPSNEN